MADDPCNVTAAASAPPPTAVTQPPGPAPQKVRLTFRIPYRTAFGQDVAMVGSTDTLGNWDPQRGVGMQWSEGDVWYVDLEVPACG